MRDITNFLYAFFIAFFNTIGYICEALFNSSDDKPNAPTKKETKSYIDDNGYRRFNDTDLLVHRWVAEKKLGRKLKRGEVVHHINRNKLDNSPENLQVFPNQEAHDEQHKKDEEKYGFEYSYMGRKKY